MATYEFGGSVVAASFKELGCADQRRNVAGQRGRRVAAGLFPPLLRSGRAFSNQIPASSHDDDKRIEVSECIGLPQSPCQDDGEGHLVELHPCPVRVAVNPEILVETSVVALGDCEIDEST